MPTQFTGWDEFRKQPLESKLKTFEKNSQLFDLIFARQLTRTGCEALFLLAEKIRAIAKTKDGLDWLGSTHSDRRAMLFFTQPSTRTFLSFLNACQILGIQSSEIRDRNTSSEVKGESPEDTIRTFSSYVDLIIMRSSEEGYAEKSAWLLNQTKRPIPVINGGSGKDEHPTQALLDLYTIQRAFRKGNRPGIDGKTVVFVGDLKRGRTVRSLAWLLGNYSGLNVVFAAPEPFQIRADIQEHLKSSGVSFSLTDEFKEILPSADVIYMTRIQDEYDVTGESTRVDFSKYHFEERDLALLKQDAVLMHPFPRRREIDVACDQDPRAAYWKQERNGMWIRCALIAQILGRAPLILAHE